MTGRERAWKLVLAATSMLGGLLARRLMRAGYAAFRKNAPSPFDSSKSRLSWPDVLLWSAGAGIALGIAKVLSARVAVFGWEAATGTVPPGTGDEPAVT